MVNDRIIFGIDIAKGSPGSKAPPKYAVAVRTNNQMEYHRMVSLHKLTRMIWQQRPDILALDNVHELTRSKRDLVSFMRRLPSGIKLVQVTGGEHQQPLTGLARKQGLSFDQLDPVQEAGVCAELASMDVGAEVSLFEDRTSIKVSRARSLGRGGWSQNRYRRKVHGHVRQKTREIEDILNSLKRDKSIQYTSNTVKGFGGYVRGEFIVNAPRRDLNMSSAKFGDVQVKVMEIERDAILYKPLKEKKRKYVIVGIDPGTTTGLALIDLEGKLVKLHSGRGISVSDSIELIARYGRPLIVATDVSPVPGTVEKIRRSFNALAGEPDGTLTAEEKINLARPYGYGNDHERDALGAAVNIFRRYRNKFVQIQKRVPPGMDVDEVVARVMKGDTIDRAIEKLTGQKIIDKPAEEVEAASELDERIDELTHIIKRQNETIDSLKAYIEDLKSEINEQKKRIVSGDQLINKLRSGAYTQLKKDKEIRIRDDRVRHLEKTLEEKDRKIGELTGQIDELKRVRNLEISGRAVPVKIVSSFTKEALIALKEQYGIKPGDVIFFKDASGGGPATVDILADAGIKAVIFRGEMAHNAVEEFYKRDLPFLDVRQVPVNYVDDMGVADPEDFNASMDRFRNELASMKKMEKERWLKNLLDEYKSERRRGIE